jgi:protein-S-isoprenylcysteine O-methyltransferase Ste14
MSVYILIGVFHEEKDLVRHFGEVYQQYMRVSGRYLPVFSRKQTSTGSPAGPGG